ncbi:hypothetical protein EYZ11_006367 [Aspergillus tanneri]|uniref:Uncharacterized protein n=1 Tax=Aspergillus tanneri TaxID=1220188 RepID=A0A4S3JFN7_9EURO|nr:hypothetical protein EYZ11_006367 [Aspergillus tanneri]
MVRVTIDNLKREGFAQPAYYIRYVPGSNRSVKLNPESHYMLKYPTKKLKVSIDKASSFGEGCINIDDSFLHFANLGCDNKLLTAKPEYSKWGLVSVAQSERILVDDCLEIIFHRALRMPDDDKIHPLPDSRDKQDYVVVPEQQWLDGIAVGPGIVRQFVSMPLGAGYTVEGQVTGKEKFGSIQIEVIPPYKDRNCYTFTHTSEQGLPIAMSELNTPRDYHLKHGDEVVMALNPSGLMGYPRVCDFLDDDETLEQIESLCIKAGYVEGILASNGLSYFDPLTCGSPELETPKIRYDIKESTPPFVNGSESDADKYGAVEGISVHSSRKSQNSLVPSRTAGNSVLISHLENRPDMSFKSYEDPPHEERILEYDSGMSLTRKRKRVPGSNEPPAETHPIFNAQRLGEKSKSALSLLLDPDPTQSGEGNSSPDASYSPSKKKPLEHPPFGDAVKQEPESPQTSQALPNFVSEKKLPLTKFIIPASEAPRQDLLPALHSPDNQHTLPSFQMALGLPDVSKDPAGRPNGSSPYHLPPGTATSPPVLRSELAWDPQRPGHFGPQVPPSPYSHWSPASTKDLSTVSLPTSQSSYWRPPKQDKPYLNPAATCAPHSGPVVYRDTCPSAASPCGWALFDIPAQYNGIISAGTSTYNYPECTAASETVRFGLDPGPSYSYTSSHANVYSQAEEENTLSHVFNRFSKKALDKHRGDETYDSTQNRLQEMGIAAGGKLMQDIVTDRSDRRIWNKASAKLLNFQILHPLDFETLTHIVPPSTPITAEEYIKAELPFFVVEEDTDQRLGGAAALTEVKSISAMDKHVGVDNASDNQFDPLKPKRCGTCAIRLRDCM